MCGNKLLVKCQYKYILMIIVVILFITITLGRIIVT